MGKLTRQAVRELSLGERMKMELIAALLHGPRLLLLDEPTIGLDVVAQAAIQKCLRDYHDAARGDDAADHHYMRDVEALCDRVLVINHGTLVYDGPLAGIIERFSESKLVKLQFEDDGARRPGPVRRGGPPRGPVRRHQGRAVAGRRGAGRDPRPARRGRRERGGPAARGGHRPGLRGGANRP